MLLVIAVSWTTGCDNFNTYWVTTRSCSKHEINEMGNNIKKNTSVFGGLALPSHSSDGHLSLPPQYVRIEPPNLH